MQPLLQSRAYESFCNHIAPFGEVFPSFKMKGNNIGVRHQARHGDTFVSREGEMSGTNRCHPRGTHKENRARDMEAPRNFFDAFVINGIARYVRCITGFGRRLNHESDYRSAVAVFWS